MTQSVARVVSVPPLSPVLDFVRAALVAYYLVGIVQLFRETRLAKSNPVVVDMANRQARNMSTPMLILAGIGVLIFLILIHIPLWIFRAEE